MAENQNHLDRAREALERANDNATGEMQNQLEALDVASSKKRTETDRRRGRVPRSTASRK